MRTPRPYTRYSFYDAKKKVGCSPQSPGVRHCRLRVRTLSLKARSKHEEESTAKLLIFSAQFVIIFLMDLSLCPERGRPMDLFQSCCARHLSAHDWVHGEP